MPRAFERDIPFFPEYVDPKSGVKVAAEDRSILPSEGNSFLALPIVGQTLDLIAPYFSSKANTAQRSEVVRRIREAGSKNYRILERAALVFHSMEQNRLERGESPDSERVKSIRSLKEKVYAKSQTPPLPKESRTILPPDSIQIASESLVAAYPDHLGSVILPLEKGSVRVIDFRDFGRFGESYMSATTHSITLHYDRVIRANAKVEEPEIDFLTMYELPQMPILYNAQYIEQVRRIPFTGAYHARFLIHEGLHRTKVSDMKIITVEDPLFNVAMSSLQRDINEMTHEPTKRLLEQELEHFRAFCQMSETYVSTQGAIVILHAQDFDGQVRQIAASGYDINEGLTEYLADPAIDHLIEIAKSKYSVLDARNFLDLMNKTRGTVGSVKRNKLYDEVPAFLERLGIRDRHELMEVLDAGQLANLYISKLPPEEYPY